MIDIITITSGEKYSYDPDTQRIFKDGKLLMSTQVEPVFSGFEESSLPKFSGIILKELNSILTLSGKINPITDINTIS